VGVWAVALSTMSQTKVNTQNPWCNNAFKPITNHSHKHTKVCVNNTLQHL
jgi:hypothetical protein